MKMTLRALHMMSVEAFIVRAPVWVTVGASLKITISPKVGRQLAAIGLVGRV